MTVVTVMVLLQLVEQQAELLTVKIVNLISQTTAQSAVIQHGLSMELAVQT